MASRNVAVVLMASLTCLVLSLVPLSGATGASSSATAPILLGDFPTVSTVKTVFNGKGTWRAYRGDMTTLGSRPAGCQSDQQMLAFDRDREVLYGGVERGLPASIYSGAEIVVLRYTSVGAARDAIARNASYPQRCPNVTEWVCEDCDGISDTWRTRVAMAQAGDQSVAWRFREVGNLKSSGYTIVARRGATVVRVTLERTSSNYSAAGYPSLMSKHVVHRLTRIALSRAV